MSAPEQPLLRRLAGKVAIANAKLAYHRSRELLRGERWRALAAHGAQTQRLLWASTSTKNPHLSDVLYVEELIGPDTVNTMPPATSDAYRDHGRPRASVEADLEAAQDTLETPERLGISLAEVTDTLLDDGVGLFVEAFGKLLAAVEKERQAIQAAITTSAAADAASASSSAGRSLRRRRRRARPARAWTSRTPLARSRRRRRAATSRSWRIASGARYEYISAKTCRRA